MRQNFNTEDKRIIRQFAISIGLSVIAVIFIVILV